MMHGKHIKRRGNIGGHNYLNLPPPPCRSSQHHNNSHRTSAGCDQLCLAGQAIWTSLISPIDNKNFAAGLKSTSTPEVVCVGEGPAAVNTVTGDIGVCSGEQCSVLRNPFNPTEAASHGNQGLAVRWFALIAGGSGLRVRSRVATKCIPAVSNHSNTAHRVLGSRANIACPFCWKPKLSGSGLTSNGPRNECAISSCRADRRSDGMWAMRCLKFTPSAAHLYTSGKGLLGVTFNQGRDVRGTQVLE